MLIDLIDVFQKSRDNNLAPSFESGTEVSTGTALVVPARPDRLFRQAAELALLTHAARGVTVAVASGDRSIVVV